MTAYLLRVLTCASAFVLLGIAAACSGAQEQDVLSKQVGDSTASGGTSGQTSGNTSGNTSGQTSGNTSGQTSGNPGTSSGTATNCLQEEGDSTEKRKMELVTCAKGQLRPPRDDSDFLRYTRPKGTKMEIHYTGVVKIRIFDENGREHGLDDIPNNPGEYNVQIDYDWAGHPLSGEDLANNLVFDWSIDIAFPN